MCARTDTLITIRQLERDDKEPIRRMLEETGAFTEEEVSVALELIDAFLDDEGQEDYYLYSAVDEHAGVVGFVCLGPTPLTAGTYDLYWIAVKPSFQGKGVSRRLLERAEQFVADRHGRLLIAETSSQPSYARTRAFYSKNSYSEVSRIKDFYKPGDDLIIYGKYLSQSEGS